MERKLDVDMTLQDMYDQYADALAPYQPDPAVAAHLPGEHMPWPAIQGPTPEAGLHLYAIRAMTSAATVGFLTTHTWEHALEVRDLFISPTWQRMGYGRAVVDLLKLDNPTGILCDVLRTNTGAQWFWTAMGFERLGASVRWGPELVAHIQVLAWPRGAYHITRAL